MGERGGFVSGFGGGRGVGKAKTPKRRQPNIGMGKWRDGSQRLLNQICPTDRGVDGIKRFMDRVFAESELNLDPFVLRENEARASLRSWLAMNPNYTYQSFLERLPEPTDKSTVSIWLSGRLSAETSRKARLLMEAAEELMIAPTGDKSIVEERYDREPVDDDDRYLMNLVHELRALSRQLCARFPVRLVHMAGKYAVPARNLIARDRTAGCGNVLSYMHDGMEYADRTNVSEPALRTAMQRSSMLREAGLGAFESYHGGDKEYAAAKFLNYDGSLRARAALVLGDEKLLEAAMADLTESLDHPSRAIDGIHINIVEVLEKALGAECNGAARFADAVWSRARTDERHVRTFRTALAERQSPRVSELWKLQTPKQTIGEELSQ